MALNYYLAVSCTSSQTYYDIVIDGVLTEGLIYDLTLGSSHSCYTIAPGIVTPLALTATIYSGPWDTCVSCIIGGTPTPTASQTPTPSVTPSVTPTQTQTGTPSVTSTPTNTTTQTQTPTQTQTGTPAVTPTQTTTQTQTPTQTRTPTQTPTQTGTPAVTPTQTGTAAVTPTPTQTKTPTQTATPTPTHTAFPISGYGVNEQYVYLNECCDPPSGTTVSGSDVPHAVYTDGVGVPFVELNSVELGGFNGLNN